MSEINVQAPNLSRWFDRFPELSYLGHAGYMDDLDKIQADDFLLNRAQEKHFRDALRHVILASHKKRAVELEKQAAREAFLYMRRAYDLAYKRSKTLTRAEDKRRNQEDLELVKAALPALLARCVRAQALERLCIESFEKAEHTFQVFFKEKVATLKEDAFGEAEKKTPFDMMKSFLFSLLSFGRNQQGIFTKTMLSRGVFLFAATLIVMISGSAAITVPHIVLPLALSMMTIGHALSFDRIHSLFSRMKGYEDLSKGIKFWSLCSLSCVAAVESINLIFGLTPFSWPISIALYTITSTFGVFRMIKNAREQGNKVPVTTWMKHLTPWITMMVSLIVTITLITVFPPVGLTIAAVPVMSNPMLMGAFIGFIASVSSFVGKLTVGLISKQFPVDEKIIQKEKQQEDIAMLQIELSLSEKDKDVLLDDEAMSALYEETRVTYQHAQKTPLSSYVPQGKFVEDLAHADSDVFKNPKDKTLRPIQHAITRMTMLEDDAFASWYTTVQKEVRSFMRHASKGGDDGREKERALQKDHLLQKIADMESMMSAHLPKEKLITQENEPSMRRTCAKIQKMKEACKALIAVLEKEPEALHASSKQSSISDGARTEILQGSQDMHWREITQKERQGTQTTKTRRSHPSQGTRS